MQAHRNRLASALAIALVSAFVLTGFEALASPAQVTAPIGRLKGTITPATQTLLFGCYRCDTNAFVTFSASGGFPPYVYYWSWGDGTGVQNSTPTSGSVSATHHYEWRAHRWTVTLKIIDLTGATAKATATVIIENYRK